MNKKRQERFRKRKREKKRLQEEKNGAIVLDDDHDHVQNKLPIVPVVPSKRKENWYEPTT